MKSKRMSCIFHTDGDELSTKGEAASLVENMKRVGEMDPTVSRWLRLFSVFLFTIAAGASRAEALPSQWVGSYSYQHLMGHAVGEPAPAWVFNITIKADGDCELTWQGYQKDDDILCKASGTKDNLKIYYVSFAGGDILNLDGFQVYKPGEKLMELGMIKGSRKMMTKWWALNKGDILKNGVHFGRD